MSLVCSSLLPPTMWVIAGGKKNLYPRHGCLDKGLVGKASAPVPGLSTVLTESGSVLSLTDNYSPLFAEIYLFPFKLSRGKPDPKTLSLR
jgi:hypothetical protein